MGGALRIRTVTRIAHSQPPRSARPLSRWNDLKSRRSENPQTRRCRVTRHGPRASIEVRSTVGWPLKSRPSSLRHAPIRSGLSKLCSNYKGKIVVEGKGFVGPSSISFSSLHSASLQISADRSRRSNTRARRAPLLHPPAGYTRMGSPGHPECVSTGSRISGRRTKGAK
jgi:hypothetical protein